jgi:hypothetical protein
MLWYSGFRAIARLHQTFPTTAMARFKVDQEEDINSSSIWYGFPTSALPKKNFNEEMLQSQWP